LSIEKEVALPMTTQVKAKLTPHVLVVDDEYFNFEMLTTALSSNFELSYADSGKSCLSSAIANPPDAILLDVCMPGLDGYDTCRLLKNTPETKDIPIVMLSGLESEQEQQAGFEAGCDAYVVKPFSMQQLLEKLKSMV
jgi:putative two-component system response regulator